MKYPILNEVLNSSVVVEPLKVELRALFADNKAMREKLDYVNSQLFALATVVNKDRGYDDNPEAAKPVSMSVAFERGRGLNKQDLVKGRLYFDEYDGNVVRYVREICGDSMNVWTRYHNVTTLSKLRNLRKATSEEVNKYLNKVGEKNLQIKGDPVNGRIYMTANDYSVRMIRVGSGKDNDLVEDMYSGRLYIHRHHLRLATKQEVNAYLKEVRERRTAEGDPVNGRIHFENGRIYFDLVSKEPVRMVQVGKGHINHYVRVKGGGLIYIHRHNLRLASMEEVKQYLAK